MLAQNTLKSLHICNSNRLGMKVPCCKNGKFNYKYSLCQLLTFGHIMDFAFPQFLPFFQKNVETNDTSFESPKTELLESGEKMGVALSWSWPRPPKQKSTSFTRICVEPFMT